MNTNFLINGTDLTDLFVSKDIFSSGNLWGMGLNVNGFLGDNTVTARSSPVQTICQGTDWKQVSCCNSHTAAIKADGTLWLWGENTYGQLGDNTVTHKSSPVQTLTTGTNWKQVSCNQDYTAAIKTDGTLWTWGYNVQGQLGTNNTIRYSSPVQTVATGTNWKQVYCGYRHMTAIKTDGTLWLWGYNSSGELGTNSTTSTAYSSPVQTVATGNNWKQVSCGNSFTSAVKMDGTLWLWGFNLYGMLGNESTTNKSSPVQTITTGTTWKQVVCTTSNVGAIKTDGTLWLWGTNNYGQLATNTTTRYSSPVQTVATGTNWKKVFGDKDTFAALKTDGTAWMWGNNDNAQLGTSNTIDYSSPVQVNINNKTWKTLACGMYTSFFISDETT